MAEQNWSCGCFEQDGVLKRECTQEKKATGDEGFSALQSLVHPWSEVCYRKRAIAAAKAEQAAKVPQRRASDAQAEIDAVHKVPDADDTDPVYFSSEKLPVKEQ
jgi:hypothetical protein